MLYDSPPEHQHGMQPSELLNLDEMDLVTRHFTAWVKMRHGDDPESALKGKFTAQELAKVGMLYEMLRDHGFWPDRIDQIGDIKWGIQLKSKIRMLFEKEAPKSTGNHGGYVPRRMSEVA